MLFIFRKELPPVEDINAMPLLWILFNCYWC